MRGGLPESMPAAIVNNFHCIIDSFSKINIFGNETKTVQQTKTTNHFDSVRTIAFEVATDLYAHINTYII